MRYIATSLASLALFVVGSFSAPQPLVNIERSVEGRAVPDQYIVKLKEGVSRSNHLAWLKNELGSGSTATGSLSSDSEGWDIINAYAGTFKGASLFAIRANKDVEYIVEDTIMSTFAVTTQTNAPWGLARLSQTARLTNQDVSATNFQYRYDSTAGAGVDVYIIDTGINTGHTDFGGRARWGATFGGYANSDGNGHGTHCAGTAVGTRWGVAKRANVIAVKVLSDSGSGSTSDIVSGVNWVVNQARASGRPSVASLSLGGGANTAMDNAVTAAVNAGVHVAVAAGNSNTNAANTSPARATAVCTVGASTISDARSSFSNYGAVVDIFAPGTSIISAWIGSTTATRSISGTSMATPHIAGLMAHLIALEGNRTPAALVSRIQALGTDGILSGIPSGTRNDLARSSIS